jgi:spermidine/putrescine transport system substrate-binding protein
MTDPAGRAPNPLFGPGARPLSRRAFLRGVGASGVLLAGGPLLAACGTKAKSSGGGSGGNDSGAKVVNWSNWPEYIDVDENNASDHPTLDKFTKATGIKVNYTEDVNDNDQYFAKVQPQLAAGQRIGADVFVVTDWMVAKMLRLKYLDTLDKANIPNAKNLEPSLANVPYDKGRQYSITYQSGFTGIAYNPKATGGKKVDTIHQLLTDPDLKGKVTALTEMRDTMGLILCDMGKDPSNFTDDDFANAIDVLQKAVSDKQLRGFTGNEYGQPLAAGDIAACIAWTGDVVQLRADNPDLQYTLPEAGFMLWSDNWCIPKNAAHKTNAEKLINFYFDPENAAELEDYVNYISPVVGAKDKLLANDPDVANNPLIFPDDATRARSKAFMALTEEQETKYNEAFQKVMGA